MGRDEMSKSLELFTKDKTLAAEIKSVSRVGKDLVFNAKLLGTIDMDIYLDCDGLLKGIKMGFNWGVISYILLLPYFIIKLVLKSLYQQNNLKQ